MCQASNELPIISSSVKYTYDQKRNFNVGILNSKYNYNKKMCSKKLFYIRKMYVNNILYLNY